MKKLLIPSLLCLTAAPVMSMVACNPEKKEFVNPDWVEIDAGTSTLPLEINTGEIKKLNHHVLPANANQGVVWISTNNDIAEIDNDGNLVGIAKGTTIICCRCLANPKVQSKILVKVNYVEVQPTAVELDRKTISMVVKKPVQLKATVLPKGCVQTVDWSSSNNKVATVDSNGVITPVAQGTAIIKAVAKIPNSTTPTGECTIIVNKRSIWDDFVDRDNNHKIDKESDWETLGQKIDEGLTSQDIMDSIGNSEFYKSPTFSWYDDHYALVKVNNVLHRVHLIGLDVDRIADETNKKALMTWEFEDAITNGSENSALATPWDTNSSNFNYWDSTINNCLNGLDPLKPVKWYTETGGESTNIRSVLSMIKSDSGSPKLANIIKPVYRTVNTSPVSSTKLWAKTLKSTKLFMPTAANIFSKLNVLSYDPNMADEGTVGDLVRYQYYAANISFMDPIRGTNLALAKYVAGTENRVSYYLSSPCTRGKDKVIAVINEAVESKDVTTQLFVAPCFCI